MHRIGSIVLITGIFSMGAIGQELSAGNEKIVEAARSRYYNLASLGFQSATCSVNFDFSTVPFLLPEDQEKRMKHFHSAACAYFSPRIHRGKLQIA
jgi:hypothetical protein